MVHFRILVVGLNTVCVCDMSQYKCWKLTYNGLSVITSQQNIHHIHHAVIFHFPKKIPDSDLHTFRFLSPEKASGHHCFSHHTTPYWYLSWQKLKNTKTGRSTMNVHTEIHKNWQVNILMSLDEQLDRQTDRQTNRHSCLYSPEEKVSFFRTNNQFMELWFCV
jgi:hypothetical protein